MTIPDSSAEPSPAFDGPPLVTNGASRLMDSVSPDRVADLISLIKESADKLALDQTSRGGRQQFLQVFAGVVRGFGE